jgi:heme/copper-type cytochrome/quinol oxidase subunit 2
MPYLPAILGLILLSLLATCSTATLNLPSIQITTRQWDHVFNVALVLGLLALAGLATMFYLDCIATPRVYRYL